MTFFELDVLSDKWNMWSSRKDLLICLAEEDELIKKFGATNSTEGVQIGFLKPTKCALSAQPNSASKGPQNCSFKPVLSLPLFLWTST